MCRWRCAPSAPAISSSVWTVTCAGCSRLAHGGPASTRPPTPRCRALRGGDYVPRSTEGSPRLRHRGDRRDGRARRRAADRAPWPRTPARRDRDASTPSPGPHVDLRARRPCLQTAQKLVGRPRRRTGHRLALAPGPATAAPTAPSGPPPAVHRGTTAFYRRLATPLPPAAAPPVRTRRRRPYRIPEPSTQRLPRSRHHPHRSCPRSGGTPVTRAGGTAHRLPTVTVIVPAHNEEAGHRRRRSRACSARSPGLAADHRTSWSSSTTARTARPRSPAAIP